MTRHQAKVVRDHNSDLMSYNGLTVAQSPDEKDNWVNFYVNA